MNKMKLPQSPQYNLSKDIWQCIMGHIDNPKDYHSTALTCKNSSKAATVLLDAKAHQFAKRGVVSKLGYVIATYYHLPNWKLHGIYTSWDFDANGYTKNKIRRFYQFGKLVNEH